MLPALIRIVAFHSTVRLCIGLAVRYLAFLVCALFSALVVILIWLIFLESFFFDEKSLL